MIVVTFERSKYEQSYLESLSPKYLYELACEDDTSLIFDDLKDFQWNLNKKFLDIEGCFHYFLKDEDDVIKGFD